MGLYKGGWPLFWRDVPSWGVYFWSYELLKEKFTHENPQNRPNLDLLVTMVCGGIAGQLSWIVSYPFDIVKTVIQTSDTKMTQLQVFKEGYKLEGSQFFWKGLGPTLSRTFIVNLVTLPCFDYFNKYYVQPNASLD